MSYDKDSRNIHILSLCSLLSKTAKREFDSIFVELSFLKKE
ncbi:hypothetical protein LEP1GSC059_1159 [Leptospira noguchii serovar Panama str. CZ214]|uniref:Uncharacterized protein n=1 Tax=Leptospira noguchii serovar Panama str. CZ214 TaxID=1001595 RepID=T0FQD3_9LEPT|nr:hypothetical protein LEP1GSC059_1159 [Leptospira noguchii serovar Panama str. CZ214]